MLYLTKLSPAKPRIDMLSFNSKVVTSDAKIQASYISHNVAALVGTNISHLPV